MQTASVVTWLRLARVHQKVERAAMEQLRPSGLTLPQFDILAHVKWAPGVSQQELADARLTTKGNLSQLLDNMEGCGLIDRVRDGRSKRVFLTSRGTALLESVLPEHEALVAQCFCSLPAAERDTFRSLLRRLDHAL